MSVPIETRKPGSGYLIDALGYRVSMESRNAGALKPAEVTVITYDLPRARQTREPSTPRIVTQNPDTLSAVLPGDTLKLSLLVIPSGAVRVVAVDRDGQILGELFPWPFGEDSLLLPLAQTARVQAVTDRGLEVEVQGG